jgi:hypothetical protein
MVPERAAFPHRHHEFWNRDLRSSSTLGGHFSSAVWGTFVILSNKAKSSHDWQFKMDLLKMIQELRAEKEQLDRVIASLEELRAAREIDALRKSRRGRKSMSPEERRQVSARMRKYWEGRRK